ncbi:retrotransposon Ty1-copia subclass [Colletotrichum sp. SAR 10_77]|nr:retrotransposon Ty1-copia subclass [Colletotrichum sp. SAR 10_77]
METNNKHDEVPRGKRLQGRSNYVEWIRNFRRAARTEDVWSLIEGKEKMMKREPNENDCLVYSEATDHPITTRSKGKAEETPLPASPTPDPARSLIKWQAEHRKWEKQKQRSRKAMDLLLKWVGDGIGIEIEDEDDAAVAYRTIKNRYAVSKDLAAEQTLEKIAKLRLADCENVTDYLNKHRQFKADMIVADHIYTDNQMVTNILVSLPRSYDTFRSQYDWIRAQQGDEKPNLDLLYDRLLIEEENIRSRRANYNSNRSNDAPANQRGGGKQNRGGNKTELQCAVCGKQGHTESNCWHEHPEKAPKALREKLQKQKEEKNNTTNTTTKSYSRPSTNNKNKPGELIAMTDGTDFKAILAEIEALDNPANNNEVKIVNTRNASIGPWFPYATNNEKEFIAMYRCVLEHQIDNNETIHTHIVTSLPDPAEWEQSSKRHVQIAQVAVKRAIDTGRVKLTPRADNNHLAVSQMFLEVFSPNSASGNFIKDIADISDKMPHNEETQHPQTDNNVTIDEHHPNEF